MRVSERVRPTNTAYKHTVTGAPMLYACCGCRSREAGGAGAQEAACCDRSPQSPET